MSFTSKINEYDLRSRSTANSSDVVADLCGVMGTDAKNAVIQERVADYGAKMISTSKAIYKGLPNIYT